MNAQLRERLEAANKELIGAAKHHQSITDAIAALAAPKEAGDAEANIEYLQRVRKEDGAEAALDDAIDMLRRLAAPSKEAVPSDVPTLLAHAMKLAERWQACVDAPALRHTLTLIGLRLAAPQADQQGASLEGVAAKWQKEAAEIEAGLPPPEERGVQGHRNAERVLVLYECAHELAALASKASPDDQRQEGAVLDWTAGGTRFDYARIGTVSGEVARQLIHDAYQSGRAGTGCTAQVDALHDAASPPTEAAAAVDFMREAREAREIAASWLAQGHIGHAACMNHCAAVFEAASEMPA